HQCYKFPHNGKIVKVKSVPEIEATEMFSAEGMPSTSELNLKEPIINILEFGSTPTVTPPDPVQLSRFTWSQWTVPRNNHDMQNGSREIRYTRSINSIDQIHQL